MNSYQIVDSAPNPAQKGTQQPPIFSPCILWPNCWMDQDTTWYRGRPQPRRHCARWGPSSPTERGTAAPTFWPMSTVAKWLDGSRIKMPLGTEVGLGVGPGDIVLNGPSSPHEKVHITSTSGSGPLWPNGWMVPDTTWYGGKPRLSQHCVRWGPSSP